jgi:hypothetical protein
MEYKDYTEKRLNRHRLKLLLTPSWLSGLLAFVLGFIFSVGIIVAFNFNNSAFQRQLKTYEDTSHTQATLTLPGETPPEVQNSLQNTWPLIAFWGMIGLAVYFVVEFFIKGIDNVQYLIVRFVSAVVWLVFLDYFIKRIIPYAIQASDNSVTKTASIEIKILYGLLSFTLITVGLHINVIFLRLALMKTRIFSSVDYSDV